MTLLPTMVTPGSFLLLALSLCRPVAGAIYTSGRQQTAEPAFITAPSAPRVTAVPKCHLDFDTESCETTATQSRVIEARSRTTLVPLRRKQMQDTVTAISDCHLQQSNLICASEKAKYLVIAEITATADLPPTFTGCHQESLETYCTSPSGDEFQIQIFGVENNVRRDAELARENCHFHAGVEHCVGDGQAGLRPNCKHVERHYNIPLRIGLLFGILASSAVGVYLPLFAVEFMPPKLNIVFSVLKQFGTGVIISTSLVHLLTHSQLMFGNECLGELSYEAAATTIMMIGLFASFVIGYGFEQLSRWQMSKKRSESIDDAPASTETVKVIIMEAGIIFHSLLVGLTLVVAGDSYVVTLFVVIAFHQMFEGIALGTRIAALGTPRLAYMDFSHGHNHGFMAIPTLSEDELEALHPCQTIDASNVRTVSMRKKILMCAAFALVTPSGMAIGIGVVKVFNGNDPTTLMAMGTLDAFSAGILLWVGIVDMWVCDWGKDGEMARASPSKAAIGISALCTGMAFMSLLGKWA